MAEEVLRASGVERGELGILLIDDREIEELNRRFMDREGPTDVISFPMDESEGDGDIPLLLGDVVISVERAQAQAIEYGVSFEEELYRLLIHGILHILGFDHERDEERMVMEGKEAWLMEHIKKKGLLPA